MSDSAIYSTGPVMFDPGDMVLLVTDGLVEARNDAGEAFGEQRLLATVCARRAESPETIVEAVLSEAEAFGSRPTDDRTLLVLRI